MNPTRPADPVTEDDLHAWVDGQLPASRQEIVRAWLAQHPQDAARVQAWVALNEQLHQHLDPILAEPPPARLLAAARPQQRAPARWAQAAALAGVMLLAGGGAGWGLRGAVQSEGLSVQAAAAAPSLVRRAMVAHAVFVPDQRRAVEVDAEHEEQLVRWLSKRLGAPMRVPQLQGLGYTLEGGRLLPGGQGPVAQFMYRDAGGGRLTLYVSNEGSAASPAQGASVAGDTSFRLVREGAISSFYWVDGPWGYAITASAEPGLLSQVSSEVYRQLSRP